MTVEYGSGSFGKWTIDEFGKPSYKYECNQYELEAKMPLLGKSVWSDYRNHYAQFGNFKIMAIPHNYGYVCIRQDEGGCKILNQYNPSAKQFSGGFGYFKYDENVLSTFYNKQKDFERYFGTCYFRKRVSDSNVSVSQDIFVPYGNDPVLVSEVTIHNASNKAIKGSWTEYWGGYTYQYSAKPFAYCGAKKKPLSIMYKIREEFSKNYDKVFVDDKKGSRLTQNFLGYNYPKGDDVIPSIDELNNVVEPVRLADATYEDLHIPTYFVASLNDGNTSIKHDSNAFFENDDILRPSGIIEDINDQEKDGFFITNEVTINPNETITLRYLVGYLEKEHNYEELIKKYSDKNVSLKNEIEKHYEKQIAISVDGKENPWLQREIAWHNAYLKSFVTYDRALKSHVISQGGYYQYIMGVNAGVRDSVQHMVPFIYFEPEIAKDLIDSYLRLVDSSGCCYGGSISGDGLSGMGDPRYRFGESGTSFGLDNDKMSEVEKRNSDQEMWLIWAICEYIEAQKDYDYLYEKKADFYYKEEKTVIEKLVAIFDYVKNVVGQGKHGIIRTLSCDWSRLFLHPYYRDLTAEDRANGPKIAESIFDGAIGCYVFGLLAKILKEINHPKYDEVNNYVNDLRKAMVQTFNGKWMPRAWISDSYGFIGDENELMMEPQPFTLLAKILDDESAKALISNIKKYSIDPSPIGAIKQVKMPWAPGEVNDGWVWWSLNGLLIWSLIDYDPSLAYKEFLKNSLAVHADNYPDVWFGIWSNSDNYSSVNSIYPGYTRWQQGKYDILGERQKTLTEEMEYVYPCGMDEPVNIVHPHAWPLYDVIKFLNLSFTKDSIRIKPSLNNESYAITSPLIGYIKERNIVKGWYNPKGKGLYRYEIVLNNNPKSVKINDNEVQFIYRDGVVSFEADTQNKVNWIIEL